MCDHHPHRWFLVGIVALLGCGNTVSEPDVDVATGEPSSPDSGAVPTPPVVASPLSLANAQPLAGEPSCVALDGTERVLALSPEGDLWLAQDDGAVVTLRVLGPDGAESVRTESFGGAILTPIVGQAQSGSRLDLIVNSEFWRLDDTGRTLLPLPIASEVTPQFCGDLTERGLLLGGIELFESRDLNWWRSDLTDDSGGALTLIDRLGQCIGRDNFTWLSGDDGSVWRLSASRVEKVHEFSDRASISTFADGVALFSSDAFWREVDGEWASSPIEGFTAPTLLAGVTDNLWFYTDGRLVRLDRGESVFVRDWGSVPSAFYAYDGGLWIEEAGQVCHVVGGHQIRVRGVVPYMQVTDPTISFRVAGSSDAQLSVTIEDAAVAAVFDTDGWIVNGVLPHIGWNEIVVSMGETARAIRIKLIPANEVSFESDISPVFQTHCAQCHVDGGESVDLTTYDDWVRYSNAIRSRSVETENMPPLGQRSDEWGSDEVQLIFEWLEGGMRP